MNTILLIDYDTIQQIDSIIINDIVGFLNDNSYSFEKKEFDTISKHQTLIYLSEEFASTEMILKLKNNFEIDIILNDSYDLLYNVLKLCKSQEFTNVILISNNTELITIIDFLKFKNKKFLLISNTLIDDEYDSSYVYLYKLNECIKEGLSLSIINRTICSIFKESNTNSESKYELNIKKLTKYFQSSPYPIYEFDENVEIFEDSDCMDEELEKY